ncbi:hypothetical protein [Nocardia nova]|uniref:hypothetical protein n=1 Tax=Nocardia nova TaxID=37330 RepID=UPI00189597C4|nr:hypothetical protein [Nocardia nova]MBF6277010.1 hypothetical protein [Nocardia nova]
MITDDGRILVQQFEGGWRDLTFVYHPGVSWEFERREPHPAAPDPARARVAELEAAQSRCQTTTAIAVWDGVADGRSIWCELPDGHDGKHHATVRQPGNVDATVDWGNPPTERIGYAVGYCLDSEFVSLSSDRLYTAPAEAAEELADARSDSSTTPFRVYELREVRDA